MGNNHNYSSILSERHYYDSVIKSINKYDSYLIYVRNYDSVVDNVFQTSSYGGAKFIQPSSLVVTNIVFTTSASAIFSSPAVLILFPQTALVFTNNYTSDFRQISSFNSNPIVDVVVGDVVFNQGENIISATVGYTLVIMPNSIFNSPDMVFSAYPEVHQYYLLSDWDGYNLDVLDIKTLQEMDYQSV